VVGAVLTRLGKRLQKREIIVDLPHDLPLVQFDGGLIEQVLLNLLDNAIKYGYPQTPIWISAVHDRTDITVSIANKGPVIADGDETRIFDKFYQGQRQGSVYGVGLGLSICRAIVDAHGGRIWCENAQDDTVRFRFTLPIGDEPPGLPLELEDSVSI
jgi:two-component system sensor histidine kinase KdpD